MSSPVCKLKWNWSTIVLQTNTTSSCWKSASNTVSEIHFSEFHNSKEKQQQRQMMLDGKFPSGCHWCEEFEKVGAASDRIVHNAAMGGVTDIVSKNSTVGEIRTLEVYFSNVCNFSCIYCEPYLSNSINKEILKFGTSVTKVIDIVPFRYDSEVYARQLQQLWTWLESNITSLEELNVLGGEPLLMVETSQVLELLSRNPAPNLDLTIVSNLGVQNKVLQNFLNKADQVVAMGNAKSIKIIGSIDGWGKEIEFQRYGLDLAQFEQNVDCILATPNVQFGINLTVTCLSIPALPALMEKWLEWRTKKAVHLSCARVEHLDKYYCLDVDVLPTELTSSAMERAISLMPTEIQSDQLSKDRLTGIYDYIKSKNPGGNSKLIGDLEEYLTSLSKRRDIDWKNYFPWLVDTISSNKD